MTCKHAWEPLTCWQTRHRRYCPECEVWVPAGPNRSTTWIWRDARGEERVRPRRASLKSQEAWRRRAPRLAMAMGIKPAKPASKAIDALRSKCPSTAPSSLAERVFLEVAAEMAPDSPELRVLILALTDYGCRSGGYTDTHTIEERDRATAMVEQIRQMAEEEDRAAGALETNIADAEACYTEHERTRTDCEDP